MIVFGILGGPIERLAKLRIVRRQGWMQVIISASFFLRWATLEGLLKKDDKLVKNPKLRHACEGRHPELFENTGFPPSRE